MLQELSVRQIEDWIAYDLIEPLQSTLLEELRERAVALNFIPPLWIDVPRLDALKQLSDLEVSAKAMSAHWIDLGEHERAQEILQEFAAFKVQKLKEIDEEE